MSVTTRRAPSQRPTTVPGIEPSPSIAIAAEVRAPVAVKLSPSSWRMSGSTGCRAKMASRRLLATSQSIANTNHSLFTDRHARGHADRT